MHVLLTCNFSPWSPYSGGGQRSTHQLASALVAMGHRVSVVFTRAPGEQVGPDTPPPYDLHWATFMARRSRRNAPLRPLNAVPVSRLVRRIHQRDPIDVIHSQGEEGAMLPGVAEKLGCPFVLTPRFPWYPEALRKGRPWSPARGWLWLAHTKYPLLGVAARRARRVCPTSASAAEQVVAAYDLDPAKVQVVPNGVNPVCFEHQWSPPGPEAPVIFFGRLHHDKGVDTLIEAMAQVERPLWIIGRGDDQAALEAQARRLGVAERVHFQGWAEPGKIAALMAGAAVVALPSRNESFGNAMAEAMAVGAPLVTAAAGSIPEVVGDDAVLVPPSDAGALAAAINGLLDDPAKAEALAAAGRARVEARFKWSAVAARFAAIYEEAAG